jgi:multisubunit Na+/H+ antiporter MnhC subunit
MSALSLELILYTGAIGLIAIGGAGLAMSNHLYRMLLSLVLAESGANLLLVLVGFRGEAIAPIIGFGTPGAPMVDPIPQVLVLTAIVIGVGVQALAVAVLVRVYQTYGTLEMSELRLRMERDICDAAGIAPPTSAEAPVGGRPLPPVPAFRSIVHDVFRRGGSA